MIYATNMKSGPDSNQPNSSKLTLVSVNLNACHLLEAMIRPDQCCFVFFFFAVANITLTASSFSKNHNIAYYSLQQGPIQ